jgi:hypothetical protein
MYEYVHEYQAAMTTTALGMHIYIHIYIHI